MTQFEAQLPRPARLGWADRKGRLQAARDGSPGSRYWPATEAMIRADIASLREIALRYTIIALGMITATLVTGNLIITVLLGGYFACNIAYCLLLRQTTQTVSRARFYLLVALNISGTSAYSFCAAYLFSYHTPALIMLAVSAGFAQALYNFSRHRRFGIVAYWDMAMILILCLWVIYCQIKHSTFDAQMAVVMVSGVGVAAYYVLAQWQSIRTHVDLQMARSEAIQTQKMRAIGQLTAGVAHDFNNILTVIQGNLELAELDPFSDDRTIYIKEAREAAMRATSLTNQLLTFSRKAKLSAEMNDVGQCFDRWRRLAARLLPETMTVSIQIESKPAHLYCDRAHLDTAILNLLINGRDATRSQGHLTIACHQADVQTLANARLHSKSADSFAVVSVTDNGPGIPRHLLDQVTEPFFTTKPKGEGSGLGLATAKGFSEQSGGSLLVTSRPGETKFSLILPCEHG